MQRAASPKAGDEDDIVISVSPEASPREGRTTTVGNVTDGPLRSPGGRQTFAFFKGRSYHESSPAATAAAQERVLAKVREHFKNSVAPDGLAEKYRLDDHMLLTFCRARNFDADKTIAMIDEHLKWRATWKPHTITSDSPGVTALLRTGILRARMPDAHFGHPVLLFAVSKFRPADIKTEDDFIRTVIYLGQIMFNAFFRQGFRPDTAFVIYDLKDWQLAHSTPWSMRLIRSFVSTLQNNCALAACLLRRMLTRAGLLRADPETMARAFLVGAPKIFSAAVRASLHCTARRRNELPTLKNIKSLRAKSTDAAGSGR